MKSWAIPAACIVAIEFAFALSVGTAVGFLYPIQLGRYVTMAAVVLSLSLVAFLAFRFVQALRQGDTPANYSHFAAYSVGVLLICLQMSLLAWTKIMMPLTVGFWADPFLSNLDAAIFQTDPWRITHYLFWWADPILDRAYIVWVPLHLAVLILLLSAPESSLKARSIVAFVLTLCAASVGQYLLPSAGPVFFERLGLGDRFSDLPVLPWVSTAAEYLWLEYQSIGGRIGTGISAMPSVHVAVALWMALVIHSYFPKFGWLGFGYFALILVGSVHLGWHYAVDAPASVAIVLLAWKFAPALTSPRAAAIWPPFGNSGAAMAD